MELTRETVPERIIARKRELRQKLPQIGDLLAEVAEALGAEAREIKVAADAGQPVIPEIDYQAIVDNAVAAGLPDQIRQRGAVIIRNVFAPTEVSEWNAELGAYLDRNAEVAAAPEQTRDRYFANLQAGRPKILPVYWSRPQVAARQSEPLRVVRAWLNRLWTWRDNGTMHFDPDRECTYADRVRRREPGDPSPGLPLHIDAGSIERWLDSAYRQVYRRLFAGDWRGVDQFDGAYRAETRELPSPAVCRAFRSFQGWTALTEQGPGNGTLQLIPMVRAILYVLLRPLEDDVAEDDFCGACIGRSLAVSEDWHAPLLPGLVTIPKVAPGDTVWWHPDVIHGVEDAHCGDGYSNVMYIGAAPLCAKNSDYLELQKPRFLAGESAPDFAGDHTEAAVEGRATLADLTPLGRKQMGFDPW